MLYNNTSTILLRTKLNYRWILTFKSSNYNTLTRVCFRFAFCSICLKTIFKCILDENKISKINQNFYSKFGQKKIKIIELE